MASTSSPGQAVSSLQKMSTFIGAVEDSWEMYSDFPSDYTVGSPIGFGASSIVYAAEYHPQGKPSTSVALKVLDLDSLRPHALALLQRETTLMSLAKHPNVIRVRGSWMDGHKLHIAMRLMNKGSAADVMRYGWQGGLEEEVVKCVLYQALKGLNYLHINGCIHRDVKAANLLIDDDGTVLLGDLGVAADLSEDSSGHMNLSTNPSIQPLNDTGSNSTSKRHVVLVEPEPPVRPRMGKRRSFVGTPCWMAPELILGKQYDSSADIWSFGITALELSMGHPPRSRESPQKVLLRTVQDDPPTLERDGGDYKYSKTFQEFVESCLVKDPTKRPTAEQLLQSSFLKGAKKPSFLIPKILKNLPPLTQRQERRILPSTQTHRSIDSWDFGTTIHSPTMSFLGKRFSQDLGLAAPALESKEPTAVFEMDHEREASSSSRSHSRAVSFVEEVIEEEVEQVEEDEKIEEESESLPSSVNPSSPLSDSDRAGEISTPPSSVSDDGSFSPPTSARASMSKSSSSKSQGGGIWARIKTVTSTNSKRMSKVLSSSPSSGLQPNQPTKPSS